MRVLVTRAFADADSLADALDALGHVPVVVPMLEVTFELDALATRAREPADWVVVSSPVGADAVAIAGPSAWRTARWAAVGPATANRLRQRGLPVSVIPERYTALDLVASMGDVAGTTVVMPRGDLAPDEPVERLRAMGATVHDVVCYRNATPRGADGSLLAALPVDVTTLFSGSVAERVAQAVPAPERHKLGRIVVVGPSTADVARRVGLTVDAVADPHTVAGVLAALNALGSTGG